MTVRCLGELCDGGAAPAALRALSVLWASVVAPRQGARSRLASISGQARAVIARSQLLGTGAGPSGWKADTNGVRFH